MFEWALPGSSPGFCDMQSVWPVPLDSSDPENLAVHGRPLYSVGRSISYPDDMVGYWFDTQLNVERIPRCAFEGSRLARLMLSSEWSSVSGPSCSTSPRILSTGVPAPKWSNRT